MFTVEEIMKSVWFNVSFGLLILYILVITIAFTILIMCKKKTTIPKNAEFLNEQTAIILPICGTYEAQRQNAIWKEIIEQKIAKHIIFVADSVNDPALTYLMDFFQLVGLKKQNNLQNYNQTTSIEVVISSKSYHNSQKIHNMLVALLHLNPEDKYVIFLDDDIQINNFSCIELVKPLVKQSNCVTTGYSIETPLKAKFVDDLIAVYRALNFVTYARQKVDFAWGGMFAISVENIKKLGMEKIWADGCYSEDMTLSGECKKKHIDIIAPKLCITINPLPDGHTFIRSYCGYVKRQFYVLEMYSSIMQLLSNIFLMFCAITAGVILQIVTVVVISVEAWLLVYSMIYQYTAMLILSFSMILFTNFGIQLCGSICNQAIETITSLTNQLQFHDQTWLYRTPDMNNFRTGVALLVHIMMMPILLLQVICKREIQWGTTFYTRRHGKVASIRKINANREITHISFKDSINAYNKLVEQSKIDETKIVEKDECVVE